ncbi:MAG: hypothetical protein ACFFBD_18020 [Candidatus Hodarchaeota archaeon]
MFLTKRNIYIVFMAIFLFFLVFTAYYFLVMQADESYASEDHFITPGNYSIEWVLAIWSGSVFLLLSGLIAIIFALKFFLRFYIKKIGGKNTLGLVTVEEMTSMSLLRKFLARSVILAFFIFNVCYALASQPAIVEFMRSPDPTQMVLFPDVEVMFHLAWLVSIPCTFVFVLIYIILDSGLVYSQKVQENDFESVNLVTINAYRLIQGFSGLGFLYNYIVLVLTWLAVPSRGYTSTSTIMMLISPIIAMSFCFPLIILLDSQRNRFKEALWNIMRELGMNKRFILNINLEPIGDFEDI